MDVLESSKKYYLDVNLEEAETSIRASLKDEAAAEDEENAEQPAEPIEFDRKTLEDIDRKSVV